MNLKDASGARFGATSSHRSDDARRRGACRAGRTRSRSRTCLRELAAAGELRLAGTRALQPSAARIGRRRRTSLPRHRARRSAVPLFVDRGDVASAPPRAALDRRRGANGAPRVPRARPRDCRRRRRRARPHARRSGRDGAAAPDSRRRAPRPRGDAPANGPRCPPAARLPPRRAARVARRAAASPFVDDETNEDVSIPRNRVRAELLPLLEERFNPSIVDVLADEAEIARDEWAG